MGIQRNNMKIGILGGGQLAMMMIQMSAKHKIDFIVVDPNKNPPASKFAKCMESEFDDNSSLDKLIENCDVVTIDFENVPASSLKYLENKINVYPSSYAVEICQDRLKEKLIFERNNIKAIDSLNKKLDPNFHQAMMEIEDDTKDPGTIVQEIQKGFTIKDRLLRPSLVGVSKKTSKKEEKTEENKQNIEDK